MQDRFCEFCSGVVLRQKSMLGRLLDRRKLLLSFVTTKHWRQNFALNLTEGPNERHSRLLLLETFDHFCVRHFQANPFFGSYERNTFVISALIALLRFGFFAARQRLHTVLGICTSRFTPCFEFWSRKI